MSVRSPYSTQIERGGYSAVVYKDGDFAIAQDEVGTIIKEGSNAATVIQAAIDSCDKKGKVVLADRFDTDTELTFPTLAWTSFASGITLQGYGNGTGINYTPATGYGINLHGTSSVLHCFHNVLDNFIISAPNTTDAAIALLGGVQDTVFNNVSIFDCPSGKAIYTAYNATYGNNLVVLSNVNMYKVLYGLYATGGPSITIRGGCFKTGLYSGVPTALEALYYTVTGYTGDGWKQLHTEDLEILSQNTDQRAMYVKGDLYFFSTHHNMYIDAKRPIYLDSGRHTFDGCFLGEMTWSVGTQITIDQTSRNTILETKDPMIGLSELQTPFRIDANSPFVVSTGTGNVVSATAANGKCVQLDAEDEYIAIKYTTGANGLNKYLGVGTYLVVVYAKDSAHVANDLKIYVQANEGGYHVIKERWYTLTDTYAGIPYNFTLESGDVGDVNLIYIMKDKATANVINIDYVTIQQIGTNFHQTVGGGHQFLYLSDALTLPTASVNFRGVLAFQPGSAGNADILKMCIKSAADTYSWKNIVTG